MQFKLTHADQPTSPVTQEQYEAGKTWLAHVHSMADSLKFAEDSFTSDMTVAFGNQPPVQGRDMAKKSLEWMLSGLTGLNHCNDYLLVLSDCIIVRSAVTYSFTNGESKTVQVMAVYGKGVNDEKASSMHVYGDYTEIFKMLAELVGLPN